MKTIRMILFDSSLLLIAVLVCGCNEKSGAGTTQDLAYRRVIGTKTLRVAYISYPPSFIKDANTGEYSGIMHEVLQEMTRRMDLKVDYTEETAWGTMIEAVNCEANLRRKL